MKWRDSEPAESPLCDQILSVFPNDMKIQITGPVLLPVILCNPLQNWHNISTRLEQSWVQCLQVCVLYNKNPVTGGQKCNEKDWIKIFCSLKTGNSAI